MQVTKIPISETAFVMVSIVDTKGIFVDCGKIDRVCWLLCPLLWNVNLVCSIASHKRSNTNPDTPWNYHGPHFTGFLWIIILHPGGTIGAYQNKMSPKSCYMLIVSDWFFLVTKYLRLCLIDILVYPKNVLEILHQHYWACPRNDFSRF